VWAAGEAIAAVESDAESTNPSDGRLLALLRSDRPQMHGVGLDVSERMLDAARARFADDERVQLVTHDLAQPLPALGRFDAIVSSFAIHHLEHERKHSLYGEVFELLEPEEQRSRS
jgi:tRNA (cmo5U34)-methyltransferase